MEVLVTTVMGVATIDGETFITLTLTTPSGRVACCYTIEEGEGLFFHLRDLLHMARMPEAERRAEAERLGLERDQRFEPESN